MAVIRLVPAPTVGTLFAERTRSNMATLFRAAIPQLSESRCSAAAFFSNRVAVGNASDSKIWVASGKQVFAVDCAVPPAEAVDPDASKSAPTPTTISCSSAVIDDAQSEIQSLWYAAVSSAPDSAGYLYSTDSKGRVSIKKVSADGSVELSSQASPARLNVDSGFVGISASAVAPTEFVTARFADRSLSLFDGDKLVRTFSTAYSPTHIVHMGAMHPNILAVAEWNQVTLWDSRVMEKSGCTMRITAGPEPLFTLCAGTNTAQPHLLAYGGAARAVTVFDVQRMSNVSHWVSCLKNDLVYANFSSTNPKHVFATGLDSEVVCGDWESSGADRFEGLRVESRWIGQRVFQPTDALVGVTQDGYAYILRNASHMIVPSGKVDRKRQQLSTTPDQSKKRAKRQKTTDS